MKSSGAEFRKHLGECMQGMGYKPCLADPDLWFKSVVTKESKEYYSYILNYVDDIMVIHHDAMPILKEINKFMLLKPDSVGDPDIYLGAKLKQVQLENDVWCWTLSPSKYINEAVRNCQKHLKENFNGQYSLIKQAPNPFPLNYEPEIDVTELLPPDQASYYNSIIGIMRWMVELGRVDIGTEVSKLSSFLAMPRRGHMEAALHVMSYLRCKHNSRLPLDPTYPFVDRDAFNENTDSTATYGDVSEALPTNAP